MKFALSWGLGGGGGGDQRPVAILIDQKTSVSTFKELQAATTRGHTGTASSSLQRKNAWDYLVSGENMNQNAVHTILRAAKKTISKEWRRNYNSFWTPQLEQLQEAVNRARESMASNPYDQSTAEYSKARAEFTRETLLLTRKQWYEKTASLNLEKVQANSGALPKSWMKRLHLAARLSFVSVTRCSQTKRQRMNLSSSTRGKAHCPWL